MEISNLLGGIREPVISQFDIHLYIDIVFFLSLRRQVFRN